jgi:hypothetical protein
MIELRIVENALNTPMFNPKPRNSMIKFLLDIKILSDLMKFLLSLPMTLSRLNASMQDGGIFGMSCLNMKAIMMALNVAINAMSNM